MRHKPGDGDSVPLQYVVGVAAWENLELVQAAQSVHLDGYNDRWHREAFCRRAEQKPPCHEEVCVCGSFDKLWSTAVRVSTAVYTCTRDRTRALGVRLDKTLFVFPPPEPKQKKRNAKSITAAAPSSVAAGRVRRFKVSLNPRGHTFPPKTEGRSWRGVVHMESVTYWLLWWSYCVPYGSV